MDAAFFRLALSQFATGVTVVLTRDDAGAPAGLTVSAFCSVSLDPPLVLMCVDLRSDAHDAFARGRVFGVSVLSETQEDVSRRFSWRGPDKFDGFVLEHGPGGGLLVPGAAAHLECRVVDGHRAGDHTIFVGEVSELRVAAGRPLLYHRGAYRRLSGEDGIE
ncbi:MAG: flavin reductase family protein [Candidatus Dormibacteraeota bacterium]|nr:flavin reductase family protein [Candidatus Dormibacteraeota bacterium]